MPIQLRKEKIDLFNGHESLTILHISDVHVWFSKSILDKLKAIIIQCNPDLLIFTGDYFDVPAGAHLFRAFLQDISVSYTVVFIRGNHDFVYGPRIANLLLGIPNCYCAEKDVYTFVSPKGYYYNITSWEQRHQLKQYAGGRNIVLIHNPERLNEKEIEGIDLILAGHLHGGQFIFFKTGNNAHFPGSLVYRYCTDRKQLKDTTMIISRGLGDTLPFRLNCPREVVSIRIE